jgi:hypothetical protein
MKKFVALVNGVRKAEFQAEGSFAYEYLIGTLARQLRSECGDCVARVYEEGHEPPEGCEPSDEDELITTVAVVDCRWMALQTGSGYALESDGQGFIS